MKTPMDNSKRLMIHVQCLIRTVMTL